MSHLKIPMIKKRDSLMDNDDDHLEPHFYSNSPKRAANLNPNSPGFREMMHRPSVRSISEMPNIIGVQPSENKHDICTYILCALSWICVIIFFPFSLPCIFRVVQEYERAVIFRLGCIKKSSSGPGVILVCLLKKIFCVLLQDLIRFCPVLKL